MDIFVFKVRNDEGIHFRSLIFYTLDDCMKIPKWLEK